MRFGVIVRAAIVVYTDGQNITDSLWDDIMSQLNVTHRGMLGTWCRFFG